MIVGLPTWHGSRNLRLGRRSDHRLASAYAPSKPQEPRETRGARHQCLPSVNRLRQPILHSPPLKIMLTTHFDPSTYGIHARCPVFALDCRQREPGSARAARGGSVHAPLLGSKPRVGSRTRTALCPGGNLLPSLGTGVAVGGIWIGRGCARWTCPSSLLWAAMASRACFVARCPVENTKQWSKGS
jgi:hypothetical protein